MQGLRPLQAHQDENSCFITRNTIPGKVYSGEESRGGGLGPLKTPKAGLNSARKALGNITNHGLGNSNILPGKTPAGSVARKALGNLTTNTANNQIQATAQLRSDQENNDRIDKLAQDGVEKLAGKGWDELERDRENRLDEEIAQRLSGFAALGRRHLPTYYPHWAASAGTTPAASLAQKEDIEPTLPSPVKLSRDSSALSILEDELDMDILPCVDDLP